MRSTLRVASPPAKPLMVFDGDCSFCSLWIRRWRQATGDAVDYLPFQDPRIAEQFPELPRGQFEAAVQLIEPEGVVFSGAEAVLRALAHKPHEHWLLDWYYRSPGFAHCAEWGYGLVARHRTLFSALTRLAWGSVVEQPTHFLVRRVFLRSLGIIYLIAFVSLWTQVLGLVGSQGITPAKETMLVVGHQADAQRVGLDRFHLVPTLCWFSASDLSLKLQCAAGTVLAVLLIIGIAPAVCLFLLWLIYLSLSTVCGEFLGFQWDVLLLQTGFLAIFLAPLQWLPRLRSEAPPSRLVLWLMRWLLFQLMFESGCVKLVSGDLSWRHLIALNYHYETQPLPTWIAWYAQQLPAWFQKASIGFMFAIELAVPFLIFAPRRLRQFACGALVLLQVLIILTGNYCFFNLLTIALCLPLLDDAALSRLLPRSRRAPSAPILNRAHLDTPAGVRPSSGAATSGLGPIGPLVDVAAPEDGRTPAPALPMAAVSRRAPLNSQPSTLNRPKWPLQLTVPLACISIGVGLMHLGGLSRHALPWPRPLLAAYIWLNPLRTFSGYGLFAVMTTHRTEIIVEGSNNGVDWLPYEFKYKPGDVNRRPRFVAPHQPRLDWQMWFAALGDVRGNRWFVNFCIRLLQGSPRVLALLERNPFPGAPPRYVRAVTYDYHFTDFATRRRTGAWWRRVRTGEYLPPISLPEERPRPKSDVAGAANGFDKGPRPEQL